MASGAAVLELMRALKEAGKSLATDLPAALSDPALTLPQAEKLLEICHRHLNGIDNFYDAVETACANDALDDDQEEAASDFADTMHELVKERMIEAMEAVKRLGGSPGLILDRLQRG